MLARLLSAWKAALEIKSSAIFTCPGNPGCTALGQLLAVTQVAPDVAGIISTRTTPYDQMSSILHKAKDESFIANLASILSPPYPEVPSTRHLVALGPELLAT